MDTKQPEPQGPGLVGASANERGPASLPALVLWSL